jgi:hypothetical protein
MWSHQLCLWVVFGPSFHKITWSCKVRYDCQLMQGGQSCCFHQATAVLFFSCSSVWSAPSPARWSNSVLNAVLCPRDQLWDPPPALLWEVSLLIHPLFQPLPFCWSLLGACRSSRQLVCWPTPALSLCFFMKCHWEFCAKSLVPCPISDCRAVRDHLFAPPPFSRASSTFHPHVQCWCQITIHTL